MLYLWGHDLHVIAEPQCQRLPFFGSQLPESWTNTETYAKIRLEVHFKFSRRPFVAIILCFSVWNMFKYFVDVLEHMQAVSLAFTSNVQ